MDATSRNATPINQNASTITASINSHPNANSNNKIHNNTASSNNITNCSVVFENGTIMGAVYEYNMSYNNTSTSNCSISSSNNTSQSTSSTNSNNNNSNSSSISSHRNSCYYQEPEGQFASIPEIVINGSYNSHQNLQQQQQQQQQQQRQQRLEQHKQQLQQHQRQGHQVYKKCENQMADSSNSSSCSSSSNCDDSAIESTALLSAIDNTTNHSHSHSHSNSDFNSTSARMNGIVDMDNVEQLDAVVVMNDEFEQFMLNRSTSDSNILESSIYSELQFPPSIGSISIGGGSSINGAGAGSVGGDCVGPTITAQQQQQCQLSTARAQLQMPPPVATPTNISTTANNNHNASVAELADLLNTSTCSRDSSSRASKRSRTRKSHKSTGNSGSGGGGGGGGINNKAKWSANVAANVGAQGAATAAATAYPPQYTAIFLDNGNAAANAMGQIANAAAAGSPYLNAPIVDAATAAAYLQQQPYQLITTATTPYPHLSRHLRHSSTLPIYRRFIDGPTRATTIVGDNQLGVIIGPPVGGAAEADGDSGPVANGATTLVGGAATAVTSTFRKCLSRPMVPFIIGIFALGGAACTLGGVVLGATGLIEHTTQYLSASLLMIGIGLSLLIVGGIIWRLCTPLDTDECPCYRLMETCRNCNSPYCNNRILPGGYLYPEFQHRPPPPSYLTSLHECAAIGLINGAVYSGIRVNTPPPLYRSTNSLSVFVPGSNSNTHTLTTNTPTTTFTPTTVMPNNTNQPTQTQIGPPNYNSSSGNSMSTPPPPPASTATPTPTPPVALSNATSSTTTTAAAEPLLPPSEQTALIENSQTQEETRQAIQATLTKEINYLELD